jgi:cytochrome P450
LIDVDHATRLSYDPYDGAIDAHVHAIWKRMRDEAPLYRNDEYDFYALSRYDDVLAGLVDVETFSSAHGTVLELMSDEEYAIPVMIMRDAPVHTHLRALASRAFTPRAITRLEERIANTCDKLLDPLAGEKTFDYVDDFAALLPPTVILALLGFPEGLEREWRERVDASFDLDDHTQPSDTFINENGELSGPLWEALPALVAERRTEPQDDLVSALVNTELVVEGGRSRPLTQEEVHAYVLMVAGAGTETVARLLSFAAVLLSEHQDQQSQLRGDHALIPNAIEEILRYEAPSPVQARWVTRDIELHDEVVPAASRMLLINGSANRDERHFRGADCFDITRDIDRHLSFGYGAHFCIGAALARLEARIALEQTVKRFGRWEVDAQGLQLVHTSTVRGYRRVPISFEQEI